jgi:hypothetical protein
VKVGGAIDIGKLIFVGDQLPARLLEKDYLGLNGEMS